MPARPPRPGEPVRRFDFIKAGPEETGFIGFPRLRALIFRHALYEPLYGRSLSPVIPRGFPFFPEIKRRAFDHRTG